MTLVQRANNLARAFRQRMGRERNAMSAGASGVSEIARGVARFMLDG
jgi:hypothetical protein